MGAKGGPAGLGHLVRRLQHLHEEGVNGRVPNELEEEEMFQALEPDGAQSRQAEQQLGEPAGNRSAEGQARSRGSSALAPGGLPGDGAVFESPTHPRLVCSPDFACAKPPEGRRGG